MRMDCVRRTEEDVEEGNGAALVIKERGKDREAFVTVDLW